MVFEVMLVKIERRVAIVLAVVVAGLVVEALGFVLFLWLHDLLLVLWKDSTLGWLDWTLRLDIMLRGCSWDEMVWNFMVNSSGYMRNSMVNT